MFCKLLFIVVFVKTYTINVIYTQYLETGLSFQKPKLEKTNIVNKGVWVRGKFNEDLIEKSNANNFIFRENSLDVDNLLHNNFDAFGGNYMQEVPFNLAYSGRQKRSSPYWNSRPRKSITGKNMMTTYRQNNQYENINSAQTKVVNELTPSLRFNDYPYEVAAIPNSNAINDENKIQEVENNITIPKNIIKNDTNIEPTTVSIDTELKITSNDSGKNISSPKRSMKYDFETEIIKKIEFTEDLNKTEEYNDNKIIDRNIFDKENSEWHQTAPIPDVNMYKVVPKEPMQKSKPVTERGLLKVISMLTKTFKKIVKQHTDIKDIHTNIKEVNDQFRRNTDMLATKFQDFDMKYSYLLKFHDKIKELEQKIANREEYFISREKEMARGLKEFENQQKKFLQQQKQFYNIQKLMLAQNDKINTKQNLIAKTQSEISHRQNNFARILKKAKQLYSDSKNQVITKLSSSINKIKSTTQKPPEYNIVQIATQATEPTTESVKINLFPIPIPTLNKLKQDPDEMILKEKDNHAIDDLIYKYYFNNTFIDSFMRSKILNGFRVNIDNGDNKKHKRNNLKTTILFPVRSETKSSETHGLKRERRWINRHNSKHSSKKRDHRKSLSTPNTNTTGYDNTPKPHVPLQLVYHVPINIVENEPIKENNVKKEPFLNMATSFCNEIHQNSNQQILRWCIEKTMRRLQSLEARMMPSPSELPTTPSVAQQPKKKEDIMKNIQNLDSVDKYEPRVDTKRKLHTNRDNQIVDINVPLMELNKKYYENARNANTLVPSESTTAFRTTTPPVHPAPVTLHTLDTPYTYIHTQTQGSAETLNFPDNDELESKIKEYDEEPDTEGNVYFEGSIHASDIAADSESGVDDIVPGLDSNSRVDVDPLTFDLQAKRRAFVRKLNDRLKMSLL